MKVLPNRLIKEIQLINRPVFILLVIFCSVQVTGILNDAAVAPDENTKLNLLLKAKEIVLYQEPKLLPQFINDVIAYQNDLNSMIRKFVVSFIEECW